MTLPAVKDQILTDLEELPPAEQRRAAALVRALVSPLPKGASIADLRALAGMLDDQSAREMMAAIEEACEGVDVGG